MMLRVAFALILGCLTVPSCGYRIAGRQLNGGRGLSISVPTFSNRTTAYRIEQRISDAVRGELVRRTRFSLKQDQGDVVVNGEVSNITLSAIILNPQGRASTYSVIVDLKVNVVDTRTNLVLFQNDHLTFRDAFELGQNGPEYVPEDAAAMDRLARRFASSLVSSILHANNP